MPRPSPVCRCSRAGMDRSPRWWTRRWPSDVILLDTSGLLAALDGSQPLHGAAARALAAAGPPRLLSPFVLAELDYVLRTRVSAQAQRALLAEVARGAYRVEPFSSGDVDVARAVMERWSSLELDLA